MTRVEKIQIVGGGTSGWLTAAYMARRLGCGKPGGVAITLIESSDIPTVGVGEATIPPIRVIISALGLDEAEFMREASATFKLAIKFDDWLYAPGEAGGNGQGHSYYHTFGKFGIMGLDLLASYWLLDRDQTGLSFVDYTMMEGRLCDKGVGPKRIHDRQYSGVLEYAYHFDAGKLAQLLKKVALNHGVRHLIGNVTEVEHAEDGSIARLQTDQHGALAADLFIDCTGFGAHLIEKAMGTKFDPYSDVLFCDRAVACQAPYRDRNQPIPPYTRATAQPNGWTWDIPLGNRRGVGYVYSSRYTDDDTARALLLDYLGPGAEDLKIWPLQMRVGSRQQQWFKNCVAIGLSGGFVEPLESTGIYLADIAIRWLTDFLVPVEEFPRAAAQFNARMNESYADIVDFVKMHYALSRRTDTDFWIDNRREDTLPDSLAEKLEAWSHRVPSVYEFTTLPKVFGLTNFLQVMYGMDFRTDLSGQEARYPLREQARKNIEKLRAAAEGGAQVLPDHRTLIDQIYTGGFRSAPQRRQPFRGAPAGV